MTEKHMVTVPHSPEPEPDARVSQTRIATSAERKSRFLLGFFQQPEIRNYLESCGVPIGEVDLVALDRDHAVARAHAMQLGVRSETSTTPVAAHPHLDALRAEATFTEHAANAITLDFAWVDVATLVACQPRVDMDHVERLRCEAPAVGDVDGLLKFCLPLQASMNAPAMKPQFNPASNTYSWLSENPDYRLCGPVQGAQPGAGRSMIGFSIGPGLHQMNVVAFSGKYMLNNGFHRAVALSLAGHDRIPVLVATAGSLAAAPTTRLGMFSPQAVFGPVPPRIADFLGAAAIDLPCKRVRLLFTVHAEVYPVPA